MYTEIIRIESKGKDRSEYDYTPYYNSDIEYKSDCLINSNFDLAAYVLEQATENTLLKNAWKIKATATLFKGSDCVLRKTETVYFK